MDFKETRYTHGAPIVLSHLSRLVVLRGMLDDAPLTALRRLLDALVRNDAQSAVNEYHVMSRALLCGSYRRVSRDIFHDYLLYSLLERENEFSRKAAMSLWDEPLCAAMRTDLVLTDALFALNSAVIKRWIGESAREASPPKQQRPDNIAVMSSAVWSGGSHRPLPPITEEEREKPAKPIKEGGFDESSFISWRYQLEERGEEYVSDSALFGLYRSLTTAADKGLLLDDMWSFHSEYGTGVFMRERIFTIKADGLSPIRQSKELDAYGFYEDQRETVMKNVVRFMQGEHADNMLITGDPGTGKSMQIFSLARELPELRLVVCPAGRVGALIGIVETLLCQPYRFLILLDDFDESDPYWPEFRLRVSPGGIQSESVLIAACSRGVEDPFFPLRIRLPAPQLKEFIELVQLILWQKGKDIDYESIQNACIDYAASANGVTFRAAGLIAQGLELSEVR